MCVTFRGSPPTSQKHVQMRLLSWGEIFGMPSLPGQVSSSHQLSVLSYLHDMDLCSLPIERPDKCGILNHVHDSKYPLLRASECLEKAWRFPEFLWGIARNISDKICENFVQQIAKLLKSKALRRHCPEPCSHLLSVHSCERRRFTAVS